MRIHKLNPSRLSQQYIQMFVSLALGCLCFLLSFSSFAENTFTGSRAGENIKAGGIHNTFTGAYCGYKTTEGKENTFTGSQTGLDNTTGSYNTFTGAFCGRYNRTGSNNTFTGTQSGFYNTTGTNNTFYGYFSGLSNKAGNNNTYLGYYSGQSNNDGNSNTFTGSYSGAYNLGSKNTFFGAASGYNSGTGSNNTYIGMFSGFNSPGSGNIFIGPMAGMNEQGSNKLHIGNGSNSLISGDFDKSTVSINGLAFATDFRRSSDRRFKKQIKTLKDALPRLMKLRGVSYSWKQNQKRKFSSGSQIGVIAQEVKKVFPELVSTDSKGYHAVSYGPLVAVAVEAIKSQQHTIQQQSVQLKKVRFENESLKDKLSNMEQRLQRLEALLSKGKQ